MVELSRLAELQALGVHAGSSTPSPASHSFAAAVQHITPAKRMRLDRKLAVGDSSRIASYFVIHVADPSKSFFKLLCWGNKLPSLKREEHEGTELTLAVGDIVLFSACVVKAYRGNVEAQYTHKSSAQLLYRRGKYFNTRDVRLKDLYPMIEWYKKKRHQFLVVADEPDSERGAQPMYTHVAPVTFTPISEMREDMLVNIRGRVEERRGADLGTLAHGAHGHDGVHLREVIISDETGASLLLNLWDQHAEPKFAGRLLSCRGGVEVCGVIISFNSVKACLSGDTTPRTEFRFNQNGANTTSPQNSEENDDEAVKEQVFTSIEEVVNSSHKSRVRLDNIVVEGVFFHDFLGKMDHVTPEYTPLLAECYCSICSSTLPIVQSDSIPQIYGSCRHHCRPRDSGSERKWRYRPLSVVLHDTSGRKLSARIEGDVLTQLLSNIDAENLTTLSSSNAKAAPFCPRSSVAALLNSLVHGAAMRVELQRIPVSSRADLERSTTSLNESLRSDGAGEMDQSEYVVMDVTHLVDCMW